MFWGCFEQFFGRFWHFFLILWAKNASTYTREHLLTITKHLQRFCSIIVTYSVFFQENFMFWGCFEQFFSRFWHFFLIFRAKNASTYTREHLLTITKHLQRFCSIKETYSVHFPVIFMVLGRFWQFFWGLFFSHPFSGLLWPW